MNLARVNSYLTIFSALALAAGALSFLALHFDIAPELSDSSYYIINTTTPQFIDNQLSMFGPLWYSLFGPLPLMSSRFLHLALVFGAGAGLGWRTAMLLTGTNLSPAHLAAALFSGAALLFYFCWALFDASYNSLVLVFYITTLLSALPFLRIQTPAHALSNRAFCVAALCFGASITFVAFAKITAAALMSVFFVLVFVAVQLAGPRNMQQIKHLVLVLLKLIVLSLLGAVIPVLLLWARLFDPFALLQHIQDGYESTALMGGHSFTPASLIGQYGAYLAEVKAAFLKWPAMLVLLAMPLATHVLWTRVTHHQRTLIWGSLALVALCTVVLIPAARTHDNTDLLSLFVLFRVSAIALSIGALLSLPKRPTAQVWAFFACLICGPLLMSAGTNNGWVWQFSPYTGLALGLMGTVVILCPWPRQALYLPAGAAISLLSLLSFYSAIEHHPYRLGGRLSEAQVPLLYGPEKIPMRAPAALAESYLALEKLGSESPLPSAPVFLDLTGRAPGLGHHLGLRPPKVAWILSGYSGSDPYFEFALSKLSPSDLAHAWILIPDPDSGEYKGLSESLLNTYLRAHTNLLFPADYTEIAHLPIAYIDRRARLFKPNE